MLSAVTPLVACFSIEWRNIYRRILSRESDSVRLLRITSSQQWDELDASFEN
jgi:hypothetical protein